jgi:hypothetical protein
MFEEVKIDPHQDPKLKEAYLEIYNILKSIKSNQTQIDHKHYVDRIRSKLDRPEWLKRQMIKLIKRRIDRIKDRSIRKKWFEFRLIVPRQRTNWIEGYEIPAGVRLKHLYFDSRDTFSTLTKIGKNGKVNKFNELEIKSYEINSSWKNPHIPIMNPQFSPPASPN